MHSPPQENEMPEVAFVRDMFEYVRVPVLYGAVTSLVPTLGSAYATQNPHVAFVVGIATSIAAGISLSTYVMLTPGHRHRITPNHIAHGAWLGVIAALGASIHVWPFLSGTFASALYLAYIFIAVEVAVVIYIRYRYFNIALRISALQTLVCAGVLVATGLLIGSM